MISALVSPSDNTLKSIPHTSSIKDKASKRPFLAFVEKFSMLLADPTQVVSA
jgi:hypothetical protein